MHPLSRTSRLVFAAGATVMLSHLFAKPAAAEPVKEMDPVVVNGMRTEAATAPSM